MGEIRDPEVRPKGYKAPKSAEELLERYARGERYFEGVVLFGANLQNADLQGVNLQGVSLHRTNFQEANLKDADLQVSDLSYSDFRRANLACADIRAAFFIEATVDEADFSDAAGAETVLSASQAAAAVGIDFPLDRTGLTLFFNTRLSAFDRFLVDGVIFGVLGRDTACKVVEFKEEGDTAIVRLQAESQHDLVAVAEALHHRVWAQEVKARDREQTALVSQMNAVIQLEQMGVSLSELVDHMDRIELRLPSDDVIEMQEDQAAKHIKSKDQQLVRTWGQKAARTAGKAILKRALKEGSNEVVDAIEGALDGDD